MRQKGLHDYRKSEHEWNVDQLPYKTVAVEKSFQKQSLHWDSAVTTINVPKMKNGCWLAIFVGTLLRKPRALVGNILVHTENLFSHQTFVAGLIIKRVWRN